MKEVNFIGGMGVCLYVIYNLRSCLRSESNRQIYDSLLILRILDRDMTQKDTERAK